MPYKTLIEEIDLQNVAFNRDVLAHVYNADIESIEIEIGSVDLSFVVGTTHPDYAGKSWGELKPVVGSLEGDFINNRDVAFQPLKRAVANVGALARNPEYYLSKEEKDYWSFYEIDGQYYIASGNNRTIIGRYFFYLNDLDPIVHGVKVTKSRFKRPKLMPAIENSGRESLIKRLLNWLK